jgi:adenine-specific DNA-methyltransferase
MFDGVYLTDLAQFPALLRESCEANELATAQTTIVAVVHQWWRTLVPDLPVAPLEHDVPWPSREQLEIAKSVITSIENLSVLDAGYRIGVFYTALLPKDLRSTNGVFYTPPGLAKRLVNAADEAGIDWCNARILDPACGGGAFLAPVATHIAAAMSNRGATGTLDSIAARLEGWELDPVSAWMSTVVLEAAVLNLLRKSGRRLHGLVKTRNSLEDGPRADLGSAGYDLVIGNPPYGKVRLGDDMRRRYRRSLYGHANLYGLFTDLALRLTKPGGVIAYVTPTSFLGGEYFKALRTLLADEAPPIAFDFVEDRRGVFADALQEAVLALYRKNAA